MDGPGPQVKGRRILEALLAASLLCGVSVLIVGRPHPHLAGQPTVMAASMPAEMPVSESMPVIPHPARVEFHRSAP